MENLLYVASPGVQLPAVILADDEIASFWKGMITHDHFDGQNKWGYPKATEPRH